MHRRAAARSIHKGDLKAIIGLAWRVPRDDVLLAMMEIASKKSLGEVTRADVAEHMEQLRLTFAAPTPGELWLDHVPTSLRPRAVEAIERGNAIGFLSFVSDVYVLTYIHQEGLHEGEFLLLLPPSAKPKRIMSASETMPRVEAKRQEIESR